MPTRRFAFVGCLALLLAARALVAQAQLAAEEELKTLRPAEGLDVSLFASEPLISNPAAIDVDTHGRVWVADIRWYRASAKQPPADTIRVLEDTDGDGRADKVTVFAEGLFCPMSICVAGDRVFVATSPDLWVFEDKDGDLRADGPPRKVLTGFGGFNHDHGAHSLVLGPDHKWWMAHGDGGFDVTGVDGSNVAFRWGGMLRGELDGSQLELIAQNFRNPYEIAVSSFGESFTSDNDNDGNQSTRVCWLMEGGDYGWFGRPPAKVPPGTPFGEHWHFRGHIPGFVPATLVTGFGAPCGMCYYEGDAFGADFKNSLLHVDPAPREVRRYPHEVVGFGMRASSEVLISNSGDDYFRPVDICAAPDGSLLLADWYDGGVGGHAYNNPSQGRIFRITPTGKKLERIGKPGPFDSVDDAIEGLKNPNLATQFLARERLLSAGKESVAALVRLVEGDDATCAARAMWVLDRIGGEARDIVIEQLGNDDERLRALAVRILRRRAAEHVDEILQMLDDPSEVVRREVLLSMPKMEGPLVDLLWTRMAKAFDGEDRYELEALHIAAGARKEKYAAALADDESMSIRQIQLLQALDPSRAATFLAQSLAKKDLSEEQRIDLVRYLSATPSVDAGKLMLAIAIDDSTSDAVRRQALSALDVNLRGDWSDLKSDDEFIAGVRKLLERSDTRRAAMGIVARANIRGLAGDIVEIVRRDVENPATLVAAIEAATSLRARQLASELDGLLASDDPSVRKAVMSAAVELQDPASLRRLLTEGSPADAAQTVEMLMTSTGGAIFALQQMKSDKLPADARERMLKLAASHPDAKVRMLFTDYLPEDQRPQPLGSVVKPEEILALKGDRERGYHIFMRSSAAYCIFCHRVQGIGSDLGPDLSQIGRKYERAALLETILYPSKAIAPEYVPYLAQTDSGQVHAGFLVSKDENQIVLKDVQNRLIRLNTDEVEVLEPQSRSLMPELVLQSVTAQDAADLLEYLTTLKSNVRFVDKYWALGPFPLGGNQPLDHDYGPETSLASPSLATTYKTSDGEERRWERGAIDMRRGYPAFEQASHWSGRRAPEGDSAFYLLTYAKADQAGPASLLIGSNDAARIWLNGKEVFRFDGMRAINLHDDRVDVQLERGRNTLLIKVVNHGAPGGAAMAIVSDTLVEISTD